MNIIERSRTIKKLFDGYREGQAYKSELCYGGARLARL